MWSVAFGCKAFGNILRTPFDLCQLATPGLAVPDLEPVVDTRDDDLTTELGVSDQRRGKHHAALLVELGLGRRGEEVPLHPARFLAERIQRGESRLDESIPILTTVGVEALVKAARDDEPVVEGLPELGGKSETVLVIDGVLVGAEEHLGAWVRLPLRPTLIHQLPPVHPRIPLSGCRSRGRRR